MATARGFPGRTAGGRITGEYNFAKQVFGVGNLDFLDSEASKVERYWRAVEYGTGRGVDGAPSQIGRPLGGGWAGRGGGRGFRHGQDLSPFGEARGQQFIPYSKTMDFQGALISARVARKIMGEQGLGDIGGGGKKATKTRKGLPTLGEIGKEIEPHEVYARGLAAFDIGEAETRVVSELIKGVFQAGVGATTKRSIVDFPGFMSVQVVSDLGTSAMRAAAGRFDQQLRAANRKLAIELQAVTAKQLVLVRPDVSSGRLKEAILDPRNRIPE